MERRLRLHEKLKLSTKLNKMTVKQGDLLVTLNLKQDIGDPNIEISDKVLYMLEQFVEKQQSKSLNTTPIQKPAVDSDTQAIKAPIGNDKIATNITPSPSKRVRFDLNPNYREITIENHETSQEASKEDLIKTTTTHMPFKKKIEDYFKNTPQQSSEQLVNKNSQSISISEPISSINTTTSDAINSIQKESLDSTTKPIDTSQKETNTETMISTPAVTLDNQEKNIDKSLANEPKTTTKTKLKRSLDAQLHDSDIHEDDEQNLRFNCRLCRLKFNNQRGLHEHVARIHGGKGGSFNLSLFADHNEQEDDFEVNNYDDDDYEDEDDESNDPFNYHHFDSNNKIKNNKNNSKKQIWNNQFKKKKLPHSNLPHPNVAIRVAKVAYYNSKIGQQQTTPNTPMTQSNTNAFKSAIFTNGGIRGNFFSQERLPLRSCKIKMKLTPSTSTFNEEELEENDRFLSHFNILKEYKPIDRNTTVTFQTTTSVSKTNDNVLTEQEVRAFFKSLLVYIPLNTSNDVIRLDDLIKLSQDSDEDFLKNKVLIDSLRLIHEIIVDSKQFGINLFDLKKEYLKRISNESFLKMNMIIVLLQLLIDNYLVLAVGVVNRVYVGHAFKQHWVIESYKNQKGRGYSVQETETINEVITEEDVTVIEEAEENDNTKTRTTRRIEKKIDDSCHRQFKPVCLIPRPWRYIDGLLNRPVLQKMFETILIYLKSCPNATFNTIAEHFCPVLQPIMTLELLEMLEKCKCVGKVYLKKEATCDLFSNFQNGSSRVINEEDLDGNEIISYYCKPNSIFTIKKLFN